MQPSTQSLLVSLIVKIAFKPKIQSTVCFQKVVSININQDRNVFLNFVSKNSQTLVFLLSHKNSTRRWLILKENATLEAQTFNSNFLTNSLVTF